MTLRHTLAFVLLSAAAATAAAQPTITSINKAELPLSGRVAIEGSGFGAAGTVHIAGLTAWTATWTDSRVVAFVPEEAALGATTVAVEVDGLFSNAVPLTVTARQSEGRVRWTFEADTANLYYRPALAPNGNLYLHSSGGFVYALSPDGGLLWISEVVLWPYVPPMSGAEGEVYLGSIATIYALSPDGEPLWTFEDPTAEGIHMAPTPGPDGLLYGAFDLGIGAFALDPADGSLEWSNSGDPQLIDLGNAFGPEASFGPSGPGQPVDQFYVQMDFHKSLHAFSVENGEQLFTTSVVGSISHQPAIGSDGTIYVPSFSGGNGWGLQAIEPDNGQILWIYNAENGNGMSEVQIDSDDTLYFNVPGHLEAVDGHTAERKWINSHFQVLDRPSLSPDGSLLLLGGVPNSGQPGFVKAFDTADGSELWAVDLPGEAFPAGRHLAADHARFTPDGSTAYVSTSLVGGGSSDPHSLVFALDVTDGGSDVTCQDVRRLVARCTADGTLKFGVGLRDAGHDGESVVLDLDGEEQFTVAIQGSRAVVTLEGQGGTGQRTVTLLEPAGCLDPVVTTCQ